MFLQELENSWTKQDEEYLGKFEDQGIYVDGFKDDGTYGGFAHASFWYCGEFGLMITEDEKYYGHSTETQEDK
jgi:hypothetical protein